MNTKDPERERLELERLRLRSERQQGAAELRLKRADLRLRQTVEDRSQWRNPLFIGLLVAIVGLAGNIGVTIHNGYLERAKLDAARERTSAEFAQQLKLQEEKRQGDLVLEAIKTGHPDRAAENLSFLLDTGLIQDSSKQLTAFLARRRPGTGPFLPQPGAASLDPLARPRAAEDISKLRQIVRALDADIIALQEVQGPAAAERIFDPQQYAFVFAKDDDNLDFPGFAVRRNVAVERNPDLDALVVGAGTRAGADITVTVKGTRIRMLSVHLKAGCSSGSLARGDQNCALLSRQLTALRAWIDARNGEALPYVIAGDFNRRLASQGDEFFAQINNANPRPLSLVTLPDAIGRTCHGGRHPFIDFLLLDDKARSTLVPESFREYPISEEDMRRFNLSDHCPISLELNAGVGAKARLASWNVQRLR